METSNSTSRIIKRHTLMATGAGLIPVPLVDIAAVTAIQLDMLRQLSRHYNANFDDSRGKAWVAALSGSMLARVGAEAIKFIPGVGSIIGGVGMAAMSGASTYALGQVVDSHFSQGGTAQDFRPEDYREEFEKHKEEGKKVAREMQDEQQKAMEKIRDLEQMYREGILTDEEYQTVKARILAAI